MKRCKNEVTRDPEEVTPDGMQAKAAEVKRAALGEDLGASVSVQAAARGHHMSVVCRAIRPSAQNAAQL
ncbi:MAG: hypothetical protein PVJ11_11975 [Syntrophobacterales bacterium]